MLSLVLCFAWCSVLFVLWLVAKNRRMPVISSVIEYYSPEGLKEAENYEAIVRKEGAQAMFFTFLMSIFAAITAGIIFTDSPLLALGLTVVLSIGVFVATAMILMMSLRK